MKVFLGWSGVTSHKVARAFHGWLPNVIQSIKPYISSEDIAKGARWDSQIAKELQTSKFGIICVTKENVQSTWINFEAGALSREIEESLVSPFLFDLRPADIQGPLTQFQHTVNSKEDIAKLVSTINGKTEAPLNEAALESAFEMWWPKLKDQLETIAKEGASTAPVLPKPDRDAMLAELLEITRSFQREVILNTVEGHEKQKAVLDMQKRFIQSTNATLVSVVQRLETLEAVLRNVSPTFASYTSLSSLLGGGGKSLTPSSGEATFTGSIVGGLSSATEPKSFPDIIGAVADQKSTQSRNALADRIGEIKAEQKKRKS